PGLREHHTTHGQHVAERVCGMLAMRGVVLAQARVLVLGATFKENCPDLRNSRALELVQLLQAVGVRVDTCDPWADPGEALQHASVQLCEAPDEGAYDAVVLAVAHAQYRGYDAERIAALGKPGAVVYDVKSVWPRAAVNDRL
ncbi:UDP binding domain-containing protein, partial [Xanthomonas fragariae]|uniref:UDP binding domain-containing protein n=3 Tax=Xanthomonas fragariae TaxID=48664 RepID=UPI001F45B832